MFDFKVKVLELSSPVCTLEVYKEKFHMIDHLVEDTQRYEDNTAQYDFAYEQFGIHLKKEY